MLVNAPLNQYATPTGLYNDCCPVQRGQHGVPCYVVGESGLNGVSGHGPVYSALDLDFLISGITSTCLFRIWSLRSLAGMRSLIEVQVEI